MKLDGSENIRAIENARGRRESTSDRQLRRVPLPKRSGFTAFLQKLRKRRIIETLAAFIGGGWLLIEVVERLIVGHYKFPEESIDLTVVSVIGALLAILVWRWFRSTEKRPGNIKVEVLLVPLIILTTGAIDLNLILKIAGISRMTIWVGVVAFLLGVAWVVYKSLQWAAARPESGTRDAEILSSRAAKDAGVDRGAAV